MLSLCYSECRSDILSCINTDVQFRSSRKNALSSIQITLCDRTKLQKSLAQMHLKRKRNSFLSRCRNEENAALS
jgi:hypothetical protein